MPVRKMKPESAEDRRVRDRVERCRKADPKFDARGSYHERCCELARNVGADPGDVFDDWSHFAATRIYLGGINVEQAEALAWTDTEQRYTKQLEM